MLLFVDLQSRLLKPNYAAVDRRDASEAKLLPVTGSQPLMKPPPPVLPELCDFTPATSRPIVPATCSCPDQTYGGGGQSSGPAAQEEYQTLVKLNEPPLSLSQWSNVVSCCFL